MRPSFLVIGAQKAGTTWLYAMLRMHPDVAFPQVDGQECKEVHFWDRNRERGQDWYGSLFNGTKIMGDVTPGYAVLGPKVIREIRDFAPSARLIYILRNPVERAWSAANMFHRNRGFDIASPKWLKKRAVKIQNNYALNLSRWLSFYQRESLLVVRYEHILEVPRAVLIDCAKHIGMGAAFYAAAPEAALRQRVVKPNANATALPRELYDQMLDSERGNVLALQAMLGWDLSSWLVPYDEWASRQHHTTRCCS